MSLKQDMIASRIPLRAFVAMGLFWGAFGAYMPTLKSATGLSDADFGLALLVGAFGAISAMWVAPWADRRFGSWAMTVGAVLMAVSFVVPSLATNGLVLGLGMFLAMGTSGMLDVIMNGRVSAIEAETNRALMNLNHALFSFAYGVAALGAGVLREFGVAPIFCFAGIALITLWLATGLRHQLQAAADSDMSEGEFKLPMGLVVASGCVILIAFVTENATEGWSALHLERSQGVGAAESAIAPAILGFTMGIGRLSGQMILRVMSEGQVLRIASLLAALGAVLAAWANSQLLAYAGFAILGAGVSVTAPMTLGWVGKTVPAAMRPMVISRVVVIGYTGFFIGPPTVGFLAQAFGLAVAFSVMGGALCVIALVLVPMMRRLARHEVAAPVEA